MTEADGIVTPPSPKQTTDGDSEGLLPSETNDRRDGVGYLVPFRPSCRGRSYPLVGPDTKGDHSRQDLAGDIPHPRAAETTE